MLTCGHLRLSLRDRGRSSSRGGREKCVEVFLCYRRGDYGWLHDAAALILDSVLRNGRWLHLVCLVQFRQAEQSWPLRW